ncbi:MAG: hypothetical protein HYR91_10915 [Flavobacteriia bacterium]|nr:hypothetical protein [Flavobacteriia bacterium]
MTATEKLSIIDSDFIEQAFYFWFNDQQHIRTPFPSYIQSALKTQAIEKFSEWLNGVHPDAKEEFNDEMFAEKFEEILFEMAIPLIQTEDERITILYPFLPRINDKTAKDNQESIIIDRVIKIDGDFKSLEVTCLNSITNEKWVTSFELPN